LMPRNYIHMSEVCNGGNNGGTEGAIERERSGGDLVSGLYDTEGGPGCVPLTLQRETADPLHQRGGLVIEEAVEPKERSKENEAVVIGSADYTKQRAGQGASHFRSRGSQQTHYISAGAWSLRKRVWNLENLILMWSGPEGWAPVTSSRSRLCAPHPPGSPVAPPTPRRPTSRQAPRGPSPRWPAFGCRRSSVRPPTPSAARP